LPPQSAEFTADRFGANRHFLSPDEFPHHTGQLLEKGHATVRNPEGAERVYGQTGVVAIFRSHLVMEQL